MAVDEVVLEPPKAARNRLFLRILARLSMPVVILTVLIALFFNVFLAGIYAILGVGVTAILVRRRMRSSPTRLSLRSDGVHYEEGSFTIEAAWSDVDSISDVASSNGMVPGFVLAESSLTWARSPKVEAFALKKGLDLVVPLGDFEADWQRGRIGEVVARFAPGLLSP